MNAANNLPRWVCLALALACAGMGLWSSIVTLKFFEHGATALETDAALQALAKGAALLFVAGEMAAFTLAALLTGRAFQARRWTLYSFAGAVLAIEIFTIASVQMAMVRGADLAQTSVASDLTDLQKQIDAAEKSAASFSATAEALRADKQVSKAMKADGLAAAERDKTSQLYDRLETARKSKRPTLTGLMGETTALIYAISRGVLVSLAGLVFFGVGGALLRSARGGALSVDQQILELLHKIHGAPVAPVAELAAPVAPVAPVLANFKPSGSVAPKDVSSGFSYSSKTALAGAGALAAMAAPMAHAAPAVPAAAPVNVDIPSPINVDIPAPMKTGVSAPVNGDVLTSPEPVNVDISSPVNVDIPATPKKARKPRVVRDGSVMDSGLSEHDGARYRRALAGVKSGKFRPSIAGLAAGVDASAPVARRYLVAMADAGVIVPSGRGFSLAGKKGGAL
jgi:hypothetical protein